MEGGGVKQIWSLFRDRHTHTHTSPLYIDHHQLHLQHHQDQTDHQHSHLGSSAQEKEGDQYLLNQESLKLWNLKPVRLLRRSIYDRSFWWNYGVCNKKKGQQGRKPYSPDSTQLNHLSISGLGLN